MDSITKKFIVRSVANLVICRPLGWCGPTSRGRLRRSCSCTLPGRGKYDRAYCAARWYGEQPGALHAGLFHSSQLALVYWATLTTSSMIAFAIHAAVLYGASGAAGVVMCCVRADGANSSFVAMGGSVAITLALITPGQKASGVKEFHLVKLVCNNESSVDHVVGELRCADVDEQGAVPFLLAEHSLSPGGLHKVTAVCDVRVLCCQRQEVLVLGVIREERGFYAMHDHGVSLGGDSSVCSQDVLPRAFASFSNSFGFGGVGDEYDVSAWQLTCCQEATGGNCIDSLVHFTDGEVLVYPGAFRAAYAKLTLFPW